MEFAKLLRRGRHYTEREVNEILLPTCDDCVTIRRYLISYGLMSALRSGSEYCGRSSVQGGFQTYTPWITTYKKAVLQHDFYKILK